MFGDQQPVIRRPRFRIPRRRQALLLIVCTSVFILILVVETTGQKVGSADLIVHSLRELRTNHILDWNGIGNCLVCLAEYVSAIAVLPGVCCWFALEIKGLIGVYWGYSIPCYVPPLVNGQSSSFLKTFSSDRLASVGAIRFYLLVFFSSPFFVLFTSFPSVSSVSSFLPSLFFNCCSSSYSSPLSSLDYFSLSLSLFSVFVSLCSSWI